MMCPLYIVMSTTITLKVLSTHSLAWFFSTASLHTCRMFKSPRVDWPIRASCMHRHKEKPMVHDGPSHIHSNFDYLLRKMPMATCGGGHTTLLGKRKTRLHTWRPCTATAAVYRSHGHIAACVGEGAQFQLGLPDICVGSVVVPDRSESFALVASQESPRSWAYAVVQTRVCGHKSTCDRSQDPS